RAAKIRPFCRMSTMVISDRKSSKVTHSLLFHFTLSCEIGGPNNGKERRQETFWRGSPTQAGSFGYLAGRIGWPSRSTQNLHLRCRTRRAKCVTRKHLSPRDCFGSASIRAICAFRGTVQRASRPSFAFRG